MKRYECVLKLGNETRVESIGIPSGELVRGNLINIKGHKWKLHVVILSDEPMLQFGDILIDNKNKIT